MRFPLLKDNFQKNANQLNKEQIEGKSLLKSLKKGLKKTHEILTLRIDDLILGRKEIDNDLIDELEEILVSSDLGVKTAHKLIEQVQTKIKRGEAERPELVKSYLKECIYNQLVNRCIL